MQPERMYPGLLQVERSCYEGCVQFAPQIEGRFAINLSVWWTEKILQCLFLILTKRGQHWKHYVNTECNMYGGGLIFSVWAMILASPCKRTQNRHINSPCSRQQTALLNALFIYYLVEPDRFIDRPVKISQPKPFIDILVSASMFANLRRYEKLYYPK